MQDLARIHEKLDRIIDRQGEQSATLAVHSTRLDSIDANLAEHMRRTKMLEGRMDKVELPIKAGKLLIVVCTGIMTVYGVVKLLIGA